MANSPCVRTILLLDPSLPVETLMTPPSTVPTGIGVETARLELADSGGEEIVVVDDRLRPLGVLCAEPLATEWCPGAAFDVDPLAYDGESDPEGWPLPTPVPPSVDQHMVPIRARIAAGASIAQACALMSGARCTRAAIVNASGRLLGLITATTVLSWIASSARAPAGPVARDDSPGLGA